MKKISLVIITAILISMNGCAAAKVEKEPVIINDDQIKVDEIDSAPILTPTTTPELTPTDALQNELLNTPAPSVDTESNEEANNDKDTYGDTINLEGMKETVNYKIYKSDLGFKISYDIDRFSTNEADGVVSIMAANPDPNIYPYVYLNISRYELSEIAKTSEKQREEESKLADPNKEFTEPNKYYWHMLPVDEDGITRYVQIKGSDLKNVPTLYEEDIDGHTADTYTLRLGDEWNSAIRKYYFLTLDSYIYKIEMQYFVEAEEGYGARLSDILDTLSFD